MGSMSKILIEKFNKFFEAGELNKIIDKIKTLSEDKKTYEVKTFLARAYNGQGKFDEALKVLADIEKAGENDYLWWYRMGHNHYYLNQKEEALKYFRHAAQLAPEDTWTIFFLRKLNMKFGIYEDKKIWDTLTVEDFIGTDESYESIFSIFEKDKVSLNIYIEDDSQLEERLPEIKENLKWLEENRERVTAVLLKNDIVKLAEEWVSGGIPVEGEDECYFIEDNEKVSLPIKEEEFLKNLYPEEISMAIDSKGITMEVYFCCYPDYFAGQCITVGIDADKNIQCGM